MDYETIMIALLSIFNIIVSLKLIKICDYLEKIIEKR